MAVMNYWSVLKKTLCILTLFLSKNVDSLTDQCNGRCDNKHFCNENSQACEPCGIFCDLESDFANPDDCQSHCPHVIYGTNETRDCPKTCPPNYYCEKFLQTCESCRVLCDPDKKIYTQKCPESCTSVESVTPSQEIGLTKTESKNTTAENNKQIQVKNKNRDIIIVSVCVGFPCAVGICLTIHLLKKRRRAMKCGEQETIRQGESELQKMVVNGGTSV
ncbi:uncharacterized protein LOC117118077 [Anneissia japonica]|uniref:uncharacterized protein LOC117118077 n=1 Tax=Anneissia japonica TaxID=1529436 RepID=UPI0014255AE2|nr:uncharacterized protein LOC117118077 [Anneissia japonica]XP_033118464.1 uncharacterized protein LOC117118077 [Anneissia japonica]